MAKIFAKRCLGALAALASLYGTAQADPVLFENAPSFPDSYSSYTSQFDGLVDVLVFDSFSLAEGGLVGSMTWQGLYVSADLMQNPSPPVALSFTIDVRTDAGGTPGASIYTGTFDVGAGPGEVAEAFLADDPNFFLGFTDQTTAAIYNYSLDLTQPLALAGSTTYWLLVRANTPTPVGLPFWGWNSGGDPAGTSLQFFDGGVSELAGDRAFSLSAVPEPSTLALAGLPVLLGLLRHWRRFQARASA